MAWPIKPRPAKSLLILRDQVDKAYPKRDKSSDGMLGDKRHQKTVSDHNPNLDGVVTAMDISNSPPILESKVLAETLRQSQDNRIKYVISARRIFSSLVHPWQWRPYNGLNAHTEHCHISVINNKRLYDSIKPWAIGPVQPRPLPLPGPTVFPHSGRGSWYSQLLGRFHWVDRQDKPNSNALGIPDSKQGISLYDRGTLGKWFEVRAPNGTVSIEQQTDIGPNPHTGRKIDISAAAAERFGYSPRNFPTDEVFYWREVESPASVAELEPKQQAVKYTREGPHT